jgi:hypothetical protein
MKKKMKSGKAKRDHFSGKSLVGHTKKGSNAPKRKSGDGK